MNEAKKQCFVIMSLAGEFQDVFHYGIKPVLAKYDYRAVKVDDINITGEVLSSIINVIAESDLIIAELSEKNTNVYYELGIAQALGKNVILLAQDLSEVPVDLRGFYIVQYRGLIELDKKLHEVFQSLSDSHFEVSPISQALSKLESVPRSQVHTIQAEVEYLRKILDEKEHEIQILKSSLNETSENLGSIDQIFRYLDNFSQHVFSRIDDELVKTKVESDLLKNENEKLLSAQLELRKLRQMTLVNPHWKGRQFDQDEDLCFLLMPFSEPWSNDVWALIKSIIESVEGCNYRCQRADEKDGRVIMDDIWEGINKAKYVIADLTNKNPNVTYEVGLADVLGKEVILLSQNPNDVPFDFLGLRLITYENSIGGVRKLSNELQKRLKRVN